MGSQIDKDFVKDVSSYPSNTDLLIASDILISDYSGIFFEFGVQDKPMFCYAYDYEEYTSIRPLYFDIRDELPGGRMNEEELLSYIKNGDQKEIMDKIYQFRSTYIQAYGDATEKSMDIIYNNIH
jgi:CDP-glycerol glycerophosphotransferase